MDAELAERPDVALAPRRLPGLAQAVGRQRALEIGAEALECCRVAAQLEHHAVRGEALVDVGNTHVSQTDTAAPGWQREFSRAAPPRARPRRRRSGARPRRARD